MFREKHTHALYFHLIMYTHYLYLSVLLLILLLLIPSDRIYMILLFTYGIFVNIFYIFYESYRNIRYTLESLVSVYNHLRNGDVTLRGIKEYISFRFRLYVIYILDIGIVQKGRIFELNYFYGHKRYKIIFQKYRNMNAISQVITADNVDITSEVFEIMGPSKDFHNISTTPQMLGYSSNVTEYIKIRYKNGEIRKYKDNEIIKLK